MNSDRKKKFSELRKRLVELTEDQKVDFVVKAGGIVNVDGRTLSRNNTVLLMMQSDGTFPTVVGGYRQWQKADRQVQRDEKGMMIWYPSQKKAESEDEEGETRFYIGTVFDISQTEEKPAY